jgi:hypothetical protein
MMDAVVGGWLGMLAMENGFRKQSTTSAYLSRLREV